jgi:hypothetical protein
MSNTPAPAPSRLRAPSKYIIQCLGRSLGGGIWISVHSDTKSTRICDLITCRGQNSVGGIRNQGFRIPKIKECFQFPEFLCERPSGETPGVLESIFISQNPSFGQYPSSPAEPPNKLRITQGVRVSVRLFGFLQDETPETILSLNVIRVSGDLTIFVRRSSLS